MVKYTRMEENKRVYTEEYDTDEYENLTCECHHLARAKELNGSRRKPFFCIYCKTVFKDKNKLNLHRLEGCFAVTGDGKKTALKIYPVFGKGQRGEIEDILIKHGLMNPRKKPSRAKRKKSAAALKESVTSMEVETTGQVAEGEHAPLRPQKLKVRGMLSSSSSHEANKKHMSSKDSEMQISYGHHEQVVDNPNSGDTLTVGQGEMQVQMQLTREQVEAQAWEVAINMLRDAYVVSRPEAVACPGLWHLMQFQLLPSDFPDVTDDSFLQAFFDFVDKGLIDPALPRSYGTWYMEREADADEEEQNAVKLTMRRFKLVIGRPDLVGRHNEKQALQAFLQYRKDCEQYEEQKIAAEKELRVRREKYVKDRLDDFDAREHAHKELAVWHWSPLLHTLKLDSIVDIPPRPWSHSDAEQKRISRAVLLHRSLRVSDPPSCPLIVRMFKLVYLYYLDNSSILSDPISGLLRKTILDYSTSENAAPVMRISAQSVLNEGSFLFANLPHHSEAHDEVYQDINFLIHGTTAEREMIVHKVQGFLRIVRQRAAGDMAQLYPKEFRVLWCGGDDSAVADALKKFMLCLKCREDLDMGWVPFTSGHPDCDSVAVMQAREAVLKAIHKLHDQRVISDQNRLLAASSHLQAIDVNASDDKFRALLETCSQRKISDSSASGSPEKGLEDVSKLERHSSYSTSGSAETLQDSRSSQEGRDTDIDVERPHNTHKLVDKPPRKPFNSSPDLNLTLDSNDSYNLVSLGMKSDSSLTAHMSGLHVVPPKTVSVLGVEVQTSDPSSRPPFPLHFYGPSNDAQNPSSLEHLRSPSLHPNVHADSARVSPHSQTRLSASSYGAETSSASANQPLENFSRRVSLLFTTQSSFSTSTADAARHDSPKESSATPVMKDSSDGSRSGAVNLHQ
ncbi:uncharacterized protein [Physcomitrium patens]|uniref:Uncharacterized protein n=1 Tax=Physcomitrium patens TaxID=3218 RepID=A0A2K1ID75_PHYPA|nr:uncharacterized protein LOC112277411 isoform X1 [Physcomitrium patens]PNR27228.1 hypothetical protein PHYPA_029380 [Physcomitrium patens]|eukprot:XP_024365415.1 uncharacterized protein LOC112277411 isoform X1 [Physcomitrella patens]